MRIAIVGAGPTGVFAAIALARRGHDVAVVDRDPGPQPDGTWDRAGVMQFHHPHAFRAQVLDALDAEMPDVLTGLLAAGAERAQLPGPLDAPQRTAGLRCRRSVFERQLRAAAGTEPGVTPVRGHADEVLRDRGRAVGVRVDGQRIDADLVLDASGRAGRLGRGLRAVAEGGDCGQAYVSRQYRLQPGAGFGPMTMPIAGVAHYPGYAVIAFPHDSGVFSTVIVRSSDDRELVGLRQTAVFDAVAAAVPLLAAWTAPHRARPITGVLPGGRLFRPWFDDHVRCDAGLAARWAGHDLDPAAPLPPDLIVAAAEVDPSMMPAVGPYLGMYGLPGTLDEVEPRAREIYATGWRPPVPAGPSRDDLVELVARTAGRVVPAPA